MPGGKLLEICSLEIRSVLAQGLIAVVIYRGMPYLGELLAQPFCAQGHVCGCCCRLRRKLLGVVDGSPLYVHLQVSMVGL